MKRDVARIWTRKSSIVVLQVLIQGLCSVTTRVSAQGGPGQYPYGAFNSVHAPYEEDEKVQRYQFGYAFKDQEGNSQERQEESDEYGTVRGSYGYTDAYGLYRRVEYIADKDGFRVVIKSNEPGLSNANPADVQTFKDNAGGPPPPPSRPVVYNPPPPPPPLAQPSPEEQPYDEHVPEEPYEDRHLSVEPYERHLSEEPTFTLPVDVPEYDVEYPYYLTSPYRRASLRRGKYGLI